MYVGITSQDTKKRWQNGYGYIGNQYFYNAIKKYGWDGFYHEIITSKLTEQEAKKFEKTLINYLNLTNRCLGYNLTSGGEGSSGLIGEKANRRRPIYKYNINGDFVCAYCSIAEAMRDVKNSSSTNISCSTLSAAANKGYVAYGYKWSFIKFVNMKEIVKEDRSIYQYDKHGSLLNKYLNIYEAERVSNYSDTSIRDWLKEIRAPFSEDIWATKQLSQNDIKNILKKRRDKKSDEDFFQYGYILQYDKYGKLIEKFKGYTNFLEKYPNYKIETLKTGIKNLRISNGYFWCNDGNKSKLINKIQNAAVISPSTIIPINKYSLKNTYISSYESITEVAKELNKKTSNILDVCLGVKNSAYGYKWRFDNEYLNFLQIDVNDIIRRKKYGKRRNSVTPNITSINNKITSEM